MKKGANPLRRHKPPEDRGIVLGLILLLWAGPGCALVGQSTRSLIVVPGGTEIFLTLGRTLDAKKVQKGDIFSATVAVPVTIDDRIVIPHGSHFLGEVDEVLTKPSRQGTRIRLEVTRMILPTGETYRVQATQTSAELPQEELEEESLSASDFRITGLIDKVTGALIGLFEPATDVLEKGSTITIALRGSLKLAPR